MTVEKKNRIAEMRKNGMGYKKIAQALELSEGTVKTFCHRNGLASIPSGPMKTVSPDVPQKPCQCCGAMILSIPTC